MSTHVYKHRHACNDTLLHQDWQISRLNWVSIVIYGYRDILPTHNQTISTPGLLLGHWSWHLTSQWRQKAKTFLTASLDDHDALYEKTPTNSRLKTYHHQVCSLAPLYFTLNTVLAHTPFICLTLRQGKLFEAKFLNPGCRHISAETMVIYLHKTTF